MATAMKEEDNGDGVADEDALAAEEDDDDSNTAEDGKGGGWLQDSGRLDSGRWRLLVALIDIQKDVLDD
jgi:hypothetical protein